MNTLDYDFGLQDNLLANDDFADGGEDDTSLDPEEDLSEGGNLPEEEEAGEGLE